jgi:hypothetical protein
LVVCQYVERDSLRAGWATWSEAGNHG